MTERDKPIEKRRIRSYVLRTGRMTLAQRRALTTLWPKYGIETEGVTGPIDFVAVFGRAAPVVFEIGFGSGESLLEMAAAEPALNFFGVEVHRPGVGHLLSQIEKNGLNNIRVCCQDAVVVLQEVIANASLHRVQLFFPDPWHKKAHHKRRLVQPDFAQLICQKLEPGGVWHIATDWQDYAQQVLTVLDALPEFEKTAGLGLDRDRPLTRFESRGRKLGHDICDFVYRKRLSLK